MFSESWFITTIQWNWCKTHLHCLPFIQNMHKMVFIVGCFCQFEACDSHVFSLKKKINAQVLINGCNYKATENEIYPLWLCQNDKNQKKKIFIISISFI